MSRRVLVVMGVSGSGKSTVGEALALRLGLPYVDADDLHPQANVDKMRSGVPLDDHDREPWLAVVGEWLARHPEGAVTSCSALRRSYRNLLRAHVPSARFVHLDGSPELIARRQADRPGHFMPASLLGSQLDTLEPLGPDEDGVVVDVALDVDALVEGAVVGLGLAEATG